MHFAKVTGNGRLSRARDWENEAFYLGWIGGSLLLKLRWMVGMERRPRHREVAVLGMTNSRPGQIA